MSMAASGAGNFLTVSLLRNDPEKNSLTSLCVGLVITGANPGYVAEED